MLKFSSTPKRVYRRNETNIAKNKASSSSKLIGLPSFYKLKVSFIVCSVKALIKFVANSGNMVLCPPQLNLLCFEWFETVFNLFLRVQRRTGVDLEMVQTL